MHFHADDLKAHISVLCFVNRWLTHFSCVQEATEQYVQLARMHGLTPMQLALGFLRDRPSVTSSIIGVTSLAQLREDLDVYALPRPLPPEVMSGIEDKFKRYKDPSIL